MNRATVFYKLPGKTEIVKRTGIIDSVLKPISFDNVIEELFLFSPYNSGNLAYVIQLKEEISKFEIIGYSHNTVIQYDTEAEFISKTNNAIISMKDSKEMSKVVMARCLKRNIDYELDINTYFLNLCLNYPNSFVYAVSSSITGTWIAATPEIFLKTNYSTIETIALAGTMLRNSKDQWGEKEIDEHHQVEMFIEQIADKQNLIRKDIKGPIDLITGHLKHLYSHFTFEYDSKAINKFIEELNPTPAVGGLPQNEAIDFIKKNENLSRRFYTGLVGVMNPKETNLFVNLRCMELFKNHLNLYAGCGITKKSDAKLEWIETENKLKTLDNFLP